MGYNCRGRKGNTGSIPTIIPTAIAAAAVVVVVGSALVRWCCFVVVVGVAHHPHPLLSHPTPTRTVGLQNRPLHGRTREIPHGWSPPATTKWMLLLLGSEGRHHHPAMTMTTSYGVVEDAWAVHFLNAATSVRYSSSRPSGSVRASV